MNFVEEYRRLHLREMCPYVYPTGTSKTVGRKSSIWRWRENIWGIVFFNGEKGNFASRVSPSDVSRTR